MKQHPEHRPALKDLLRNQSGIVAIYMAVCLPVFVGLLILVADGSYALSTHRMLKATADSAALAAVHQVQPTNSSVVLAQVQAAAQQFAQLNMPGSSVLANADVVLVQWVSGAVPPLPSCTTGCNAVQVTTRSTPKLFFFKALGWNGLNVSATAIATFGGGSASTKTWDAVIAQDISASFASEIAIAKAADKALLGCMASPGSASMLGLSLFTSYSTDSPLLTPLTNPQTGQSNNQTLLNAINSYGDCGTGGMPQCSGTNIAAGMNDAIAQFTSTTYKQNLVTGSQQNLVVVSDGQPNACSKNNSPPCSTNQAAALAQAAATAFAGMNIPGSNSIKNVSAICYSKSTGSCNAADAQFMQSLVKGNGIFLTVTDTELSNALCKIAAYTQPSRLVW